MVTKPQTKEQKRQASTRAILDAALDIFEARGFAGASMSQIAQKANVPQALIYHYYESKEALWKAVKLNALQHSHLDKNFGASDATSLHEFLTLALTNRFSFYQAHPKLHRLIMWEALEGHPNLLGIDKAFEGIWTKDIRALQAKNIINPRIDAKLLSALMRNAFSGVLDDVLKLYDENEQKNKQKEYLTLVVHCIESGCNA